ncbi:hypothetical protein DXG01_011439 [Tephrocybe rancida]|nr:hypothetical protein DXG01_011439 [Tephrocybe rancida]
MAFIHTSKSSVDVTIDGRGDYEEKHWWDPALRDEEMRPGPGMIPTMLAQELHDPHYSLFSVHVSNPDYTKAANGPPATPIFPSTAPAPPPPTDSDLKTAVPHPNAYYCPKENGWVILSWESSSLSPPYAKSFRASRHQPLPDQERRRRRPSCLEYGLSGPANKTHHFHKYEKAVDPHKLTPPFRMEEWEVTEKRRVQTINEDIDIEPIDRKGLDSLSEADGSAEQEGRLLDLYICCQCSLYCVASGVIPGVIPRKCFDEFIRDRRSSTPLGKSGEIAVHEGLDTIRRIIENRLWKGEIRFLRPDRPQFQSKLGWTSNVKQTLEVLGFTVEISKNQPAGLRPPPTDLSSTVGRMNRRRLLRAWVEVSAWVADFEHLNASQFKDISEKKASCVQIENAREMYQIALGAHPSQITRGKLSGTLLQTVQLHGQDWQNLGLTPMSYSSELLAFAYYAQVRCDPAKTVEYFTSFSNIVGVMQSFRGCPQSLLEILATERSRGRFTLQDLNRAATILGLGENNLLSVEYNEADVPEEFLENAWKACVKRSWWEPVAGAEMLRSANEAFRMLAEARGSGSLLRVWESGMSRAMTPEKAYDTFESPGEGQPD